MEVALFTDSHSPNRDGVSAVTGGLARNLARFGNTVRVYVPNPRPGPPTETRRRAGARAAKFVRRSASLDRMARRFMFLYQLLEEGRHSGDVGLAA